MSARSDSRLPFDDPDPEPASRPVAPSEPADAPARRFAVDPLQNVVLEASAGTGKTRVLVERYVNLLRAGVDPANILAITFTRKAAGEMRLRIVERLREASRRSEVDRAQWRQLKDRLGDIAISTIDAFCLALLREFPLEADVDPGFTLASDTEAPRLLGESLDQALRICRGLASRDEDVSLVFAQLGERRLRAGLSALVDRRLVAPHALRAYLAAGPRDLTVEGACRTAAGRLREALTSLPGGLDTFLADGPQRRPGFALLAADLRTLAGQPDVSSLAGRAAFRALADRVRGYFLTQDGRPREKAFAGTGYAAADCDSADRWRRHRFAAAGIAPRVAEAVRAFRRDLNVVIARGVWRIFAVALGAYERTLEAHALLDFSGVLDRAIRLLQGLDEFAPARFRLESRYRHVLVDEFQDTSRAQWTLVAQLVRNWGEGLGASADAIPPSIFIVGDRKQSIYGFRDADVTVLDEAATFVAGLGASGDPRRAITVSFRAAPSVLAFVNDVFDAIDKVPERRDAFRYSDADRFPVDPAPVPEAALGAIVAPSVTATADRAAAEVARLVGRAVVRDRVTGIFRPAGPGDIAILFRTRDAHQEFEKALERHGIATYVYKGLGFFEAEEVQDAVALLRYLADPLSNLRAAAFLRSRLVRISDGFLADLAPDVARSVLQPESPAAAAGASPDDQRVFELVRREVPRWLSLVDRLPPAVLLDFLLAETAYAFETRGHGRRQARENVKKLRAMVSRFQNRGYATLSRVANHLDELAESDEANAAIDAQDAVSLMTVHAAKGLEFPIVFVVNLNRGTAGARAPIRVTTDRDGAASVAIADYQSEADEDTQAREREETKRLTYVALTRARDQLYLCGVAKDGQFRPTRGSLGEVLPSSLKLALGTASLSSDPVTWIGPSGRMHQLNVV
jgi:ATP-dependent helicase/nuclease subunit A